MLPRKVAYAGSYLIGVLSTEFAHPERHPALFEELASSLDYMGIVIGGLLDAETFAILGGLSASNGNLCIFWVFAAAVAAGMCGDGLGFLFGRVVSARLLARRPAFAQKVEGFREAIERHPNPLILGLRFLWGVRAAVAFALGMSRVSLGRFLALDLIGSMLWAGVMVGGSYLCGHGFFLAVGEWKFGGAVAVAVILAGLVALLWVRSVISRRWSTRWQKSAQLSEVLPYARQGVGGNVNTYRQ